MKKIIIELNGGNKRCVVIVMPVFQKMKKQN